MKVTLDIYLHFVLSHYGQNKLNREFQNKIVWRLYFLWCEGIFFSPLACLLSFFKKKV